MTTLDSAGSPTAAPAPSPRYRLGLLALDILGAAADAHPLAVSALAVRAVREGGLPAPLTPARLDAHVADARAWLEAEAEAGRDLDPSEVAAAFTALRRGAAPAAPVGELVPPTPSAS